MSTNNSCNQPELTTNGLLLIGNTASPNVPSAATLTAGTGIGIVNGNGTITINSNGGGLSTVDQSSSTVTMAVNTQYIVDNGASLVTLTLPATAAIGDSFRVIGKSAGLWTIAEASGQTIHFGTSTCTATTGTLSATAQWDCVTLVCVTANTTFSAYAAQGNLTVV